LRNSNLGFGALSNKLRHMEKLFQSITSIQKYLAEAGISSLVIGGVAVGAWGEPRLTRDVDLKVLLTRQDTERLLEVLSGFSTPLVSNPRELLKKQAVLFIQDNFGTRIDLLLAETPYDVIAIQRGRNVEIQPGISIRMCSPEDLIIYKLISTRMRDHEDVVSVIRRQANSLDDVYILDWLSQFEEALYDSTLVDEYRALRFKYKS